MDKYTKGYRFTSGELVCVSCVTPLEQGEIETGFAEQRAGAPRLADGVFVAMPNERNAPEPNRVCARCGATF